MFLSAPVGCAVVRTKHIFEFLILFIWQAPHGIDENASITDPSLRENNFCDEEGVPIFTIDLQGKED